MQFDDWLDPGLTFAVGGREYRVVSPSALTVLRWHRMVLDPSDKGDDRIEAERALGVVWQELADNGVSESAALHAGRAVIVNYLDSAERALAVWTLRRDPPKPVVRPTVVHGVRLLDNEDPPGTLGPDDPGGGRYNRRTKQRDYYFPAEWAPSFQAKLRNKSMVQWSDILGAWDAVIVDFDHLGHDLTTGLLDARPWHWFAVRLAAVLGDPGSRTSRLIEAHKTTEGVQVGDSAG